ncbi:hypothetical protein B0T10DRAFT_534373 [Thelonectria olida]|uniref:Phospho-2-dehydro-3-deoxyheptonate aldolase n=1 Tax=Thelonectria olida TaxID=1576542 RepID=A0A9P8VQ85_9HYPO|nr:hypothetical protein B0T10DRAFT_534373 [Thelonectria olida]
MPPLKTNQQQVRCIGPSSPIAMLRYESQRHAPELRSPPSFPRIKTEIITTRVREINSPVRSTNSWTPESWRSMDVARAVEYSDTEALNDAYSYLKRLPPLISHSEIEQIYIKLYHVAIGCEFVIQGDDCAESFHDVQYDIIKRKEALGKTYAKPRPKTFEILPSDEKLGYFYSAASQNTIRHVPDLPLFIFCSDYDHYNLSATTIWLGERTRQLDGAHFEYARGLRNPVGVKIGPSVTTTGVVALLNALAPGRAQHGKITIIALQLSGHIPIWMNGPCHANTFTTSKGVKTRRVEDMLVKLQETYIAHRSLESHLGGIHIEQTGDDVMECID